MLFCNKLPPSCEVALAFYMRTDCPVLPPSRSLSVSLSLSLSCFLSVSPSLSPPVVLITPSSAHIFTHSSSTPSVCVCVCVGVCVCVQPPTSPAGQQSSCVAVGCASMQAGGATGRKTVTTDQTRRTAVRIQSDAHTHSLIHQLLQKSSETLFRSIIPPLQ